MERTCDICLKKNITEFSTFSYLNIDNSLDVCEDCRRSEKLLGVFKQILETNNLRFKCDLCRYFIHERCSVINGRLFLCCDCFDPDVSIEATNEVINHIIDSILIQHKQ